MVFSITVKPRSSVSDLRFYMKRALKRTALLITVPLMLFAGCASVGPDYVPPDTKVPSKWSASPDSASGKISDQSLANWWTVFNDPVLSELVELAVAQNPDIKTAEAKIREVRAQRNIAKSDYFPTANVKASSSGSRSEKDNGDVVTGELYNAGFDASWEIDIFGGTRRAVESANAELDASVESMRDVLVSVVAEVAMNYTDVRSYQTRLSIAEQSLELQSKTYDIAKWRAEAGLTTRLDVEQARYSLEATRASIPSLKTGLVKAENRLAVLLGKNPSSLADIFSERKPVPVVPVNIAVGVPADVLRRRPDVRKAERSLASATAQIGVASAQRFPSLTLSGSTGLESEKFKELFSSGTWLSSIASNIGYTLFDAGRIRQNINITTAQQEQALAAYESSVLIALEEVENALTAFAGEQERRQSLYVASQSAEKAVELVTIQYKSGQKDFLSLLEAQRSMLNYKDQLATSDGQIASDLISLYKALGGGWTPLKPNLKE